MAVVVAGRKIATTAEHPFYVQDRGWVPAGQLSVGDWVHSHDGQWTPVTALELTGTPAQVYNFRIADHQAWNQALANSASLPSLAQLRNANRVAQPPSKPSRDYFGDLRGARSKPMVSSDL